jgi:hypothetical protein
MHVYIAVCVYNCDIQNLTSGEECDDETWEIIKENFEVTQHNRLTKKGFHDLHKETVKDEQGGISELWDTLQAMGYNKALQLDEAWPFEFDVYCDQCKPDLSVSGFEAEDRKLEAAVIASVSNHSDRIPVKGHTGLIIHKFTGDSRLSLAVENRVMREIIFGVGWACKCLILYCGIWKQNRSY